MNLPEKPLSEIARLFTRLGFTAFGGPAAHIAMMEDEVVTQRRWLDRQSFLDLVGLLNFIPGPNSTELAIHIGLIRGGMRGLLIAGVCFIGPAVLIILPLAWLYVHYAGGSACPPPMLAAALKGVSAAVVALLAAVAIRFRAAAVKNRLTLVIALLTFPADYLLRHPNDWIGWNPALRDFVASTQSEIVILLAAALIGITGAGVLRRRSTATLGLSPAIFSLWTHWERRPLLANMRLPFYLLAADWGVAIEMARIAWFFFQIGITLFGSGYVLVSYLETGLVHQLHWLTPQQLSDAVAVGQFTPGPLLTTATFIGFLRGYAVTGSDWGGVAGALTATVAIFSPAFVLVALLGRRLKRLSEHQWARAALDGMNAAVVSLLILVTIKFASGLQTEGRPDWTRIAIAATCLGLMLWKNVNATWLILGAGAAGIVFG